MMLKNEAPPYSNRGVQSTEQSGVRACVDWLQVTFKNFSSVKNIIELIGLDFDDFKHHETGNYGYSNHYRFGNISVYYSEHKDHMHLEITGQGCRQFEQLSVYDWTSLLALINMLDVNVTRLDLAIDDFENHFTMDSVKRKIRKGHVKSRFKTARDLTKHLLSDGSIKGETLYFGSETSDLMVRFYDKKKEREGKGFLVTVDNWIRVELQLRRVRADLASILISQSTDSDIGEHIRGILKNYLNFLIESKTDSNKKRWKVCSWWEKFLGDVEKVKLTQVAPDATIERAENWTMESVSGTFKTVLEAKDYDIDYLIELIQQGDLKQSKKHEMMLDDYYAKRGIKARSDKKTKLLEKLYEIKNDLNRDHDSDH